MFDLRFTYKFSIPADVRDKDGCLFGWHGIGKLGNFGVKAEEKAEAKAEAKAKAKAKAKGLNASQAQILVPS